ADGHISGEPDGVVTSDEAFLYVNDALRTVQVVDQQPELASGADRPRSLIAAARLEPAPALGPELGTSPSKQAPEPGFPPTEPDGFPSSGPPPVVWNQKPPKKFRAGKVGGVLTGVGSATVL